MTDMIAAAVDSADKAMTAATGRESISYWLDEIKTAAQREKEWRGIAQKVVGLFEGTTAKTDQYNILYSNTETLAPALYNTLPRPLVRPQAHNKSPQARAAAMLAQQILVNFLNSDDPDNSTVDELWSGNVLAALLPGRGVLRFKYEAEVNEPAGEAEVEGDTPQESGAMATEAEPAEPTEPQESLPAAPGQPSISNETICAVDVPWNNFLHGYGKHWCDVPWVDYIHLMSEEEFKENFPGLGKEVDFSKLEIADTDGDDEKSSSPTGTGVTRKSEAKGAKLVPVHEIWDKSSKMVRFVSEVYTEDFLKPSVPDPLELKGFYPGPAPLTFTQKLSSLVPLCLYSMYEEQAKELNRVTVRIQRLISAMKVRGGFDATVTELEKIIKGEDNSMVGITNAAALYAQGGTIDKAIWMFPIEKLPPVLQQLYLQRQQIKAVIFEITGIADIMRGSTQASETLGAQQIKNQWGTLRLKRMQRKVAVYTRRTMRMYLELAVSKFPPERLKQMSGSQLPMAAQKQQLAVTAQQAQMSQQPLPPDMQAALAQPAFEEILALLQNDLLRDYTVDIETNSTVEADATEDKQDVIDVMTALGQFFAGIGPMVADQTIPFGVAKGLLMAIVAKFKLGTELSEYLEQMQQPPPKPEPAKPAGPPPEDPAIAQQAAQTAQLTEQAKQQTIQLQMAAAKAEHDFKMQELARKDQLDQLKAQREMQKLLAPPPPPAPTTRPAQPRR